MMSKISFSKIRMEDAKHRLSVIIICSAMMFFKELLYFITMQNTAGIADQSRIEFMEQLKLNIVTFCGGQAVTLLWILPLAVLFGVNAFHFLHNRSRVDFQFSLPMSRGTLYRLIVTNDLLLFLLPYAVSLAIQIVITAGFGCLNGWYLHCLLRGIVSTIVAYLLIYLTTLLAMLLTGQMIVGLLAFGVFATYAPFVVRFAIELYLGYFMKHFWMLPDAVSWFLNHASPVFAAGLFMKSYCFENVLSIIFWFVLLFAITYRLFCIRPAESAGKAMAFQRGKVLIKVMITIPMAMLVGIFFNELTTMEQTIWLLIGVILGSILFHGMIECIYQTDIRGLWSHKKHLIAFMVATLFITLSCEVDPMGYDSYVPKAESVKSIIVDENGNYGVSYDGYIPEESKGISGQSKDQMIHFLKDYVENEEEGATFCQVRITYKLSNGKKSYRSYSMSEKALASLDAILYGDPKYKEERYPVFQTKEENVTAIEVEHPLLKNNVAIEKQEFSRIIEVLKEDISQMSYEDISGHTPICVISITEQMEGNNTTEKYAVLPSFQKTISYLESKNYHFKNNLSGEHIVRITYDNYGRIEGEIRDPDQIASVQDELRFEELGMLYNNSRFAMDNSEFSLSATLEDGREISLMVDEATRQKIEDYIGNK